MGSAGDRQTNRIEHITRAVVGQVAKMRAAFSTIDGGHQYREALMGPEGQKRIIRISLHILREIGIDHKTDRTIRRALAYTFNQPPIGWHDVTEHTLESAER